MSDAAFSNLLYAKSWPVRRPPPEQTRVVVAEICEGDADIDPTLAVLGNIVIVTRRGRIISVNSFEDYYDAFFLYCFDIATRDFVICPPPVSDPHVYYSNAWSRNDLTFVLECSTRMHAKMFVELFDLPPDPDLLETVELCYEGGALVGVKGYPHDSVSVNDWLGLAYARDNIATLHEFVRARTDTLVGVEFLFEPSSNETMRVVVKRSEALSDVMVERHLSVIAGGFDILGGSGSYLNSMYIRWYEDETRIFFVKKASTKNFEAAIKKLELLLRLKCNDIVVYEPNNIGLRLTGEGASEFNALWRGKDDCCSAFCGISWHTIHAEVLSIVIALYPMHLPIYTMLWILQKINRFYIQREIRMLRLIEGVMQSCASLKK